MGYRILEILTPKQFQSNPIISKDQHVLRSRPSDDASQPTKASRPGGMVGIQRILYFFYFAAFGVMTTFLNVYYHDAGLSGVEIGLLASILPLVSIFAAPVWGMWSDRTGQVKRLLTIANIGIIFAVCGIWISDVFFLLALFTVVFAFFDSSILPIMDSTTLRALGKDRDRFGRQRLGGSLGFILAAWGVGNVLERIGSRWLFLFFILMILAVVIALHWMPNQRIDRKPTLGKEIAKLILKKEWLIFSASLLLVGLGGSAINGFLGIYIKDLGGNEGLVGAAAALATVTELPVFFWSTKILKRYPPRTLLMVAFGVSVLRLSLYGVMPSAGWVIPISLLHFLTFGIYWIAAVAYVDQMAADEIKSSAQGMFYAVLNVSRMLASIVCGFLYDQVGGSHLFLITAGFSIFAVILLWMNKPKNQAVEILGGEV